MSDLKHAPTFDLSDARQFAYRLFGLEATARPLPSERDQNFLLSTKDGQRYVFKIANGLEKPEMLRAQQSAMDRVEPGCPGGVRRPVRHKARTVTPVIRLARSTVFRDHHRPVPVFPEPRDPGHLDGVDYQLLTGACL